MNILHSIFGLDIGQLTWMIGRATIIFFLSIFMIRISGIRTLGKHSSFDHLTLLILAAILGRAIVNAQQPFFASLCTVLFIVVLHRVLAWAAFRSKTAGVLFKGRTITLMENYQWQENNLIMTEISMEDIEESLRQELQLNSFSSIRDIYLERSGKISFVKEQNEKPFS